MSSACSHTADAKLAAQLRLNDISGASGANLHSISQMRLLYVHLSALNPVGQSLGHGLLAS